MPPNHCPLARPRLDSYSASFSLRILRIKLERLLFSSVASADSLALSDRSILNEIVVSFIVGARYYDAFISDCNQRVDDSSLDKASNT